MIRPVIINDAKEIADIYNYYVSNTVITFEEELVSAHEMMNRIKKVTKKFPWVVYEEDGQVLGFAFAEEWKSRTAYKYSVESSVYLKNDAASRGIGTNLYLALIQKLSLTDIHAVIGGISLPNDASIALHEKLGYRKVAHFKEIGYKFNEWIDVGYWQLLLESKNK